MISDIDLESFSSTVTSKSTRNFDADFSRADVSTQSHTPCSLCLDTSVPIKSKRDCLLYACKGGLLEMHSQQDSYDLFALTSKPRNRQWHVLTGLCHGDVTSILQVRMFSAINGVNQQLYSQGVRTDMQVLLYWLQQS